MQSQSYSTEAVPEQDRHSYWASSIEKYFGHLEGDGIRSEPFHANCDFYDVGDIVAVRMNVPTSRVMRLARDAVDGGARYLKLSMLLKGHATVTAGGRSMQLGPGDWVVLDQSNPYTWESPASSSLFGLQIPRRRLTGLNLPKFLSSRDEQFDESGMVPILGSYLQTLEAQLERVGDDAAVLLADATVGLFATTLEDGRRRTGHRPDPLAIIRLRAQQHITAHAGDAALSVDSVAEALHCSRRHLYKAFSAETLSPDKLIWQVRLERCHGALMDPRNARRLVASIAYENGFKSDAHFARLFRAKYGRSATEIRQLKPGAV